VSANTGTMSADFITQSALEAVNANIGLLSLSGSYNTLNLHKLSCNTVSPKAAIKYLDSLIIFLILPCRATLGSPNSLKVQQDRHFLSFKYTVWYSVLPQKKRKIYRLPGFLSRFQRKCFTGTKDIAVFSAGEGIQTVIAN
jgi:hypothetical protein